MKIFARFLPFALAMVALSSVHAQTVTLTASNIRVGGTLLSSGQFCVVPVDASNHPLSASALGGSTPGAETYTPACTTVTNGSLGSGFLVPDTSLATPTNMCLRMTITDANGIQRYMAPCVQPGSSNASWCTTSGGSTTCNFDNYSPVLAAVAPITSPTLAIGTVTTGNPGAAASAAINGRSPNYSLNLTIPSGVAGPNCSSTSPAGQCNLQGVSASVNTQINVQASPYNAKGDCTTDDSAAIQAAVNAAGSYNPPAAVVFPKPSGGCYLTSTIQWNGAPLLGQDPPHGFNYGGGAVVIKGKPGQDILHVQDPTTAGSVAPARSWSIRKLTFMVDNSVAGSFPHRWPGRWISTATMTASSASLTATGAAFTCGDVGQPVRVIGAGVSGADLVTTIASVPSCSPVTGANNSATLATAASTGVTNALAYISVHNIPVTMTIGNAAIAFDNYDGKAADWLMTGSVGSLGSAISDVDIDATNGNACQYLDQCPTSAAIYFQGVWAPYGMDARNINIAPGLMFGIVEGTPDTNPQLGAVGQDYQTWEIGGWHTVYPWISYNGTFNKISRIQLADQFGPAVLSVSSGIEYQAGAWVIDDNPEFEQNCYYLSTAPSTCVPGIGWRIDGGHHTVHQTKLASNGATAYLDSFVSTYTDDSILGELQLNGYDNNVRFNGDMGTTSVTAWSDNGIGNVFSGAYLAGSAYAQSREAAVNATRGHALVGEIGADFVRTGNVSNPYPNDRDLLFWPNDFVYTVTNPRPVVLDPSSLSGKYAQLTSSDYISKLNLFNLPNGNPNAQIGRAMICNSPAGCEIPATNSIIYVSAKCPSDSSYVLRVQATNSTVVSNTTIPCSTTYTTQQVAANFSSFGGSYLILYFGVTSEVDVAWFAVRPFQADYNGYQPLNRAGDTMTGPLYLSADPVSSTQAATKNYVDTHSSSATLVTWFSPVNIGGTAGLAFVANKTVYTDFLLPYAITAHTLLYKVSTADNTSNVYNIGLYYVSGGTATLVAQTGAIAGTSFAASTGNKTLSWSSSPSLQPGDYLIAATTNCTASCAALAGSGYTVPYFSYSSSGVGSTSAGALPSSITLSSGSTGYPQYDTTPWGFAIY